MEVECKAKAEPFIVLLPSQYEAMQFRCLSRHARTVMPSKRDDVAVDLNGTALFDPVIPVGHSVLSKATAREQPDKAWSAAIGAAKAANWFATRFDETEHTECHIAFPVVVTDAVLATAELTGGQVRVIEVEHARFVLKWPLGDTSAVIVDAVRKRALGGFVNACAEAARLLLGHTQEASSPR